MRIEELKPAPKKNHNPKRVGRGQGSGHGKTSTRGHKGQKARSGGGVRVGFEGGQMPLQRRLPKRGFTNPFRKDFLTLNIKDIADLNLDTIEPQVLIEKGIIKSVKDGIKILGEGEIKRAVNVRANAFSKTATQKIKSAGGTVEVI
ncbi:MAG: 50S ribosomal protein L15 [Nitrospirae bacterium]|nr:50S ribosomal protein L15 [Nitrospirota bacterium]